MKKLFQLIIVLGTVCAYSHAFQLPTEDELQECFKSKNVDQYFLEKTHAARELGSRSLVPVGANLAVELLFADFAEYLGKDHPAHLVNLMHHMARANHKSDLLDCIFKNNPRELAELKKQLEELEAKKNS